MAREERFSQRAGENSITLASTQEGSWDRSTPPPQRGEIFDTRQRKARPDRVTFSALDFRRISFSPILAAEGGGQKCTARRAIEKEKHFLLESLKYGKQDITKPRKCHEVRGPPELLNIERTVHKNAIRKKVPINSLPSARPLLISMASFASDVHINFIPFPHNLHPLFVGIQPGNAQPMILGPGTTFPSIDVYNRPDLSPKLSNISLPLT
jgi:hypothetical protein